MTETVEQFYTLHAYDGRAILRVSQWREPLFWIIRTKVMGRWEYALCAYTGDLKPMLGTIDITVVEAQLPRYEPPRRKHHAFGEMVH